MKFQCFDAAGQASTVSFELDGPALWESAQKMGASWVSMLVMDGKRQTSYVRNDDGEWACWQWGKNKLGLKFADS